MKVHMVTDIEGVAGVVDFATQAYFDGKYYEQAKLLLTAEVNAAIEGFLEQDVEDILVSDGHGPGAICYEMLHPKAKLRHGRPPCPQDVKIEICREYDVCAIVGQHAMAGVVDGNMNHTQSSRTVEYFKLNDIFIGEIAQVALFFGALDIPLIYVTGDHAACREAKELIPDITVAQVKKGLSRNSAISLSKEQSCEKIREKAKLAIINHKSNPIKPLKWQGPFTLEKRFFTSEFADSNCGPQWQRVDSQTIRRTSDSILEIIYS